jgi:hypothetical protein
MVRKVSCEETSFEMPNDFYWRMLLLRGKDELQTGTKRALTRLNIDPFFGDTNL